MSVYKKDSNAAGARMTIKPASNDGIGPESRDPADEQLMTRVRNGDAAALEILYDRYAALIMGFAFRLLADRALSEEIVQETFWRVWRSAATFDARRGGFAGWLFGIARNLTIDLCRRRKIRPQPLIDEDQAQPIEHAPDPDVDVAETAWISIKRAQVRAALGELPAAQRTVIDLAYFRGMTRQEIAEVTGEPLGTIHTRARLALQKLREILQAQGFED